MTGWWLELSPHSKKRTGLTEAACMGLRTSVSSHRLKIRHLINRAGGAAGSFYGYKQKIDIDKKKLLLSPPTPASVSWFILVKSRTESPNSHENKQNLLK